MRASEQTRITVSRVLGVAVLLASLLLAAELRQGAGAGNSQIPIIFKPDSTPADSIYHLSLLVLAVTGFICLFLVCSPMPSPSSAGAPMMDRAVARNSTGFMMKAVLNGRGDEIIDLARVNLFADQRSHCEQGSGAHITKGYANGHTDHNNEP
jgi:hypothetical protein